MKGTLHRSAGIALVAALALAAACAPVPPAPQRDALAGTAWRLVIFRSGDDSTLVPDDPSKYTIDFRAGGSLSVRFDCNRGHGTWRSEAPGQLRFGLLALTRALCPPGSLHDHLVRQWPYVRSYVIRDGRLYLSLMADGGIYEFEPAR